MSCHVRCITGAPRCANLLWNELALDKFFRPLHRHFQWGHFTPFRSLVVAMAFMWGRWNVTNLYQYLNSERHQSLFNNFFLVERWDPKSAVQEKA